MRLQAKQLIVPTYKKQSLKKTDLPSKRFVYLCRRIKPSCVKPPRFILICNIFVISVKPWSKCVSALTQILHMPRFCLRIRIIIGQLTRRGEGEGVGRRGGISLSVNVNRIANLRVRLSQYYYSNNTTVSNLAHNTYLSYTLLTVVVSTVGRSSLFV